MNKKILSNLLNYATRAGAKNLVIEKSPEKISLNYHFANNQKRSFCLPKKLEKNLSSALRQVLKLAPDELTTKKYCKIEDKTCQSTFYLTVTPTISGEKIIINIIPKDKQAWQLKQLGLQNKNLKTIQKTLRERGGLILISSPDGQGKGTTLSSLLQEINTPERSLYFLGDNRDYDLDGINNLTATYNNWQKVLNLDSDVIATEINTEDDFKMVTLAAITGRLVLATITANSVWETLLFYLKLKLPLKLKLDSLKLILNQRVFPLKRTPKKNIRTKANKRQGIGLFEVLKLTPDLKKYLLETENDKVKNKFWEKLGRLAIKDGYEPLVADQKKKIKDGLIDS